MPETENDQQSQTEPQSSGEGTQPSDQPGSAAEFQWSADAPDSVKGKTPEQVAAENTQMVEALRTYAQQQAQVQAAQQQAAAQANAQRQAQQSQQSLKDIGEMLYSEPEKALSLYAQQQQALLGQQVGGALTPLYEAQAAQARTLAQNSDRELWSKYGSEIDQIAATLPVTQRANPNMWNEIAGVVKGRHVEDIAQERAQRIAAEASSGVASGFTSGPGKSGNTLKDQLEATSYGRRLLKNHTPAAIRRNLEKIQEETGTSPEDYLKMVSKNETEIDEETGWRTSRPMGGSR